MTRWVVVGLALLLAGCATSAERARYAQADVANRQSQAFVRAYNACVKSDGYVYHGSGWLGVLSQVGALGDRWAPFYECMERAGWIQSPRHHPAAIGRYERQP